MDYCFRVCAGLDLKFSQSLQTAQTARVGGISTLLKLLVLMVVMQFVLWGQNITTIAGGGPPNGVKATTAPIGLPWGVVQDSSGNTYISDNFSNRIFKVDTSGNLSVVAGNGLNNYTGDGGAATAATLSAPEGIAFDGTTNVGALYIADTGNNVVRVVNTNTTGSLTLFAHTGATITIAAGSIDTVAGDGAFCTTAPCGDGGVPKNAQMTPSAVSVDSTGNVLIADAGSSKNGLGESVVRELTQSTGLVSTVAGNFTHGFSGDGAPATSAQLNFPAGIFLDSSGDIYIADTNNAAIRVVNRSGSTKSFFGASNVLNGNIATVAGTPPTACSAPPTCGDGVSGGATLAGLNSPSAVSLDGSGNLWIVDTGDEVVRWVDPTATIHLAAGTYSSTCSTVPCGDNGSPTSAELSGPSGIFVDTSGDLFIADQGDDGIRKVTTPTGSGTISTIAGVIFNQGYYGDGGPATPNAEILNADGVATDATGNVYIADTGNNVIRKVDSKGNISTVAGSSSGIPCAQPNFPCGDGGAATSAQLAGPQGVFIDAAGDIFIADTADNVIREVVASTGKIQAVVGTEAKYPCTPSGTAPECGDGGLATAAQLGLPSAVVLDKLGNIYIADTQNNVIRVANTQAKTITVAAVSIPTGEIETVAGDAATYSACAPVLPATKTTCGDSGPATSAQLNSPKAILLDKSGNIFIADNGDNVIRKVDTGGTITTVAGDYAACTTLPCGNGSSALSAQFNNAIGLWLDYSGNIYVADAGLASIRAVNTQASSITIAGTTISAGNIDRVVGTGVPGFSGDGAAAGSAQLDRPHGLWGNAAGDLFITDVAEQRVRKVSNLLATAPTASLSTSSLTFASQAVGTTSASQTVTVTNKGNISSLTVSTVALSGADSGDFKQTNNCTSVAAGSSCTITVTFTPTAGGSRSATISITDNAVGSPQTVTLTGTAVVPSFTVPSSGTLSPSSVSPGTSATATITVTSVNSFTAAVALTCKVSSSVTNAPACSLNPSSVTPQANGNITSTLTVTTTAASATALMRNTKPWSGMFFATLFLPAMLLSTAGMGASRRRKAIGSILLILAIAGSIFLVACGGSSSSSGGGGGTGTPSGSYTITVTGTSGAITQTETFTLTVQ